MTSPTIEQLLQEDLAAAEKSFRRTVAVVGVVALVVLGYLHWAYSNLRQFMAPETLAEVVLGFTEVKLSDALTSFTASAAQSAPQMADAAFEFLADSIGMLRLDAEEAVENSQNEIVLGAESWLQDYFDQVIRENEALAKLDGKNLKEEQAVLRHLAAGIDSDIDRFFATSIDSELDQLTKHLRDLRTKLQNYTSGRALSAREQEERELLMAWLQMLDPDVGSIKEILK